MGIYTESNGYRDMNGEEVEVNFEELMEQFFYDDHYNDSDAEKAALFESAEMALLEKKNISSKKTMVRLNKNDDITRRSTMAALQIAKDKDDSLWKALTANRVKERKLLKAIKKKYGNAAARIAKIGQREYIKGSNQSKMFKSGKEISHRD